MVGTVIAAAKGKGSLRDSSAARNLARRAFTIISRYGPTTKRMDLALGELVDVLEANSCGATLPVTATPFMRNARVLERYQRNGIELAAHGYLHVDYSALPFERQFADLSAAHRLFQEWGVGCSGSRCPYLRWNAETISALRLAGYTYDSSQAIFWDVVGNLETPSYRHVLGFYGAIAAETYPSLPSIEDGVVRIPYCLPDDEALVDRMVLPGSEVMTRPWIHILTRTHELGELFTVGLHPERTQQCKLSLVETLRQARGASPRVWITRLDDIARWWLARSRAAVDAAVGEGGEYRVDVAGPDGVTLLTRGVEVIGETRHWDGTYQKVTASHVRVRAKCRPFIGISPSSSPGLLAFLVQQGYIVERADRDTTHSIYLDRPAFSSRDERPLLAEIEKSARPLVRLGRWPHGAKSALCVTGDVDALTVWDYGRRLFGG